MRAPRPLYEIFGRKKELGSRWVGSPLLNRVGLHAARIALTDVALGLRRRGLAPRGVPPELDGLVRDGVAVIPDILPPAQFDAMRAEVRAALAELERRHGWPVDEAERGFGRKRPFDGGFDRYDGGTLNRFLDVSEARTPLTAAAVRDPRIARLCSVASGFHHRPARFQIYQTIHGDEAGNPDPQRATHRDTFHSTIKLWLFLDDATVESGPFMYAPGSHRMTAARYRWEHARACAASRADVPDRDGSFRAGADDLATLGLAPPRAYPVLANTLVIADVRGFHRRGDAAAGVGRLALYANLRLWPFAPWAF